MASTVILKAAGLNTSPNELSVPEGSLTEASNILIRRDGIIEQRRGFKLHGNSAGTSTDRVKQLTVYRGRLIRHVTDKLQFDSDNLGTFSSFAGSFLEADPSLRMKFIESNGNLYFTTSNGVQKLSSKTAGTIVDNTIVKAGATKSIDIEGNIIYTLNSQNGFLPQDSTVAYRVVWGYKDANGNLILGSPSQREIVYNFQLSLMLQDHMRLLGVLDSFTNTPLTTARINDKNYVSGLGLTANSSTSDLRTALISLASKLDNDILYADTATAPLFITAAPTILTGVCTVTFSTGDPSQYLSPGSKIFLSGFTATTDTINGQQVVVTADATTITFNTIATGPVTISSPTINSGEFRAITEPPVAQVPAVHIDNLDVQAYMSSILSALRALPDLVISAADQLLLDAVDITTTATVTLDIAIPQDIDGRYFYQIYRSSIFSASDAVSIDDVIPNDELQLVYEAFPTLAEIAAGTLSIIDVTPDDFKGANLYTNNSTGEGILQANETPPFAKDINRYRNVVFYANTHTKHKTLLNLLGVQSMIADFNAGTTPSITIATATSSNTYTFVTGLRETTNITTVADVADSLNSTYFLLDSTTTKKYYFYFETTTAIDPLVAGRIGIKVNIPTGATASQVASALKDKIAILLSEYEVSVLANVVTITNIDFGTIPDPVDGTVPFNTGFTFTVTTQGRGEDLANNQVLLSTNDSPAIAVDETARSLIRAINFNSAESVYGFYLSGAFDVPGKMLLEARNLEVTDQFFLQANNATTGISFNPAISPSIVINSITIGTNPVITTSTPHGFLNRDIVMIGNTDSTPSIDGVYEITFISPTTFSILKTVTIAGTTGAVSNITNVVTSENETKPNRIYYSKPFQPEAVPAANFFDVGAEDKAILRIIPLRDSFFVFKEDGLFRISGDSSPFQLNLFDSSFIVTAPDSVTVSNNVVFAWTTQGIQSLTEGGAAVVSRQIDNLILQLGSVNYQNFKTATWGIGYESDNSYIVWTVSEFEDVVATIAYRFSTLTQSWTTYNKTNTCGIINNTDDRLYLGAGDTNFIEQERKMFDRTDFADREFQSALNNNFLISPTIVKLNSVTGFEVGDVLLQDQTIATFEFNTMLLKLDTDPSVVDSDYVATLALNAGSNPRTNLLLLAAKLDADTGVIATNFLAQIDDFTGAITANTGATETVITSVGHGLITGRTVLITGSNSSPSINGERVVTVIDADNFSIPLSVKIPGTTGTWLTLGGSFADLKVSYNRIMSILNLDNGVSFNNYRLIDNNTIQEAIILEVNQVTKQLTLNIELQFLVGAITIYKAIRSSTVYSPISMGDPLNLKHLREATVMFQTRNITKATVSFATDLLPELIPVEFNLDGNGIFGHSNFGAGFFGGSSNSAPFRTFIPRQCQRCRFIIMKIEHNVAREDYRILGGTITANESLSTRAYR